jgi:hypothetical protein
MTFRWLASSYFTAYLIERHVRIANGGDTYGIDYLPELSGIIACWSRVLRQLRHT